MAFTRITKQNQKNVRPNADKIVALQNGEDLEAGSPFGYKTLH